MINIGEDDKDQDSSHHEEEDIEPSPSVSESDFRVVWVPMAFELFGSKSIVWLVEDVEES